jgi:hypothetical protein
VPKFLRANVPMHVSLLANMKFVKVYVRTSICSYACPKVSEFHLVAGTCKCARKQLNCINLLLIVCDFDDDA